MDKKQIVSDVEMVLDRHDQSYSHSEIVGLVNRWAANKGSLIELLRKHPNWDENSMAVVWDYDSCRDIDETTYRAISTYLSSAYETFVSDQQSKIIPDLHTIDEDEMMRRLDGASYDNDGGYWIYDRWMTLDCLKHMCSTTIPFAKWDSAKPMWVCRTDVADVVPNFMLDDASLGVVEDGPAKYSYTITINDVVITNPARALTRVLNSSCSHLVTEAMKSQYDEYGLKCSINQRASRALNAALKAFGVPDCVDDYEQQFGLIADAVNPLAITRHTLLSVHPCDYLHMSYGNSWGSCHNIDNGCYMAGTLSYMGDGTSMIFYTVDRSFEGEKYFMERRINRQVYAFDNNVLIQSRLYPDYHDTTNRVNFRNAVQSIFATCLGMPNIWTLKTHNDSVNEWTETADYSQHYPDYDYNEYCATVSLLNGAEHGPVLIGSKCYCISCGDRLDESGSLHCECEGEYGCYNCGDHHNEDDMHFIDGEWYCEDCCHYCDYCEAWVLGDTEEVLVDGHWMYVCDSCKDSQLSRCDCCGNWFTSGLIEVDGNYYCEDCFESEDFVFCGDCETWVTGEDAVSIDGGNTVVCADCAEKNYTMCSDCGEWFSGELAVVDGHRYVCADCLEDKYHQCEKCGEWVSEAMHDEALDIYLCVSCCAAEGEVA